MGAMLADYLAAGPLIMQRIRDAVADIAAVLPARDLSRLAESELQSPAVFVVYDGDRLGDAAGRGGARIVHQRWLVVLAVRNAAQSDGGAALTGDAGPLLSDLLEALQGWAPSVDHRPLYRVAAPLPGYSPAFGFYPLAFEAALITVTA